MELKTYWKIICRRKWIVIVSVAIAPMFAYALMMITSPIYKSEAKLWVKMNTLQQKFFDDISDWFGKLEFSNTDNALGTIEELLNNSESVGRVITKLGLTKNNGEKYTPAQFTNPYKVMLILHLQEKGYREEQITDSDVIKITGYSTNPIEARAIAGGVIQELIDTFHNMYKNAAVSAGNAMLKRVLDTQMKLENATLELERFRTANQCYSISTQTSTLISEMSSLESERITASSSLKSARNNLKNVRDASLFKQNDFKDALVQIESSDVINNYKDQLIALETEHAKMLVEATVEHPNVKILGQQIELVKGKIQQEVAKSFSSQITGRNTLYDSISSKYSDSFFTVIASSASLQLIEEQLITKKNELAKIPELERENNRLQWVVDNLKNKHDSLLAAYETIKSAEILDLANLFVFQPPTLFDNPKDNQFFPPKKKKSAIAVAGFLGLFMGLFLVFFIEYWNQDELGNFDRTKKVKEDISA